MESCFSERFTLFLKLLNFVLVIGFCIWTLNIHYTYMIHCECWISYNSLTHSRLLKQIKICLFAPAPHNHGSRKSTKWRAVVGRYHGVLSLPTSSTLYYTVTSKYWTCWYRSSIPVFFAAGRIDYFDFVTLDTRSNISDLYSY